jgi:23S rRNA (cytosine1962-C5)-methyltransferase
MTANCSPKRSFLKEVQRSTRLRATLFGAFREEPDTTAYRLVHGEGDGLAGFLVDVYGPFLVVQVTTEEALGAAPRLEEALEAVLQPQGIVRKQRYVQEERGRVPAEAIRGERPPQFLTVKENGIPFEVELLSGLHSGLFTDMRDERARLLRLSRGKRVLNTFAYTGAFSVAAAVGGAATVTTVDVVAKVLERAKRNFALAGIDPAPHYFVRMEVLEYLSMAKRRGWRFDAVVLDPPTFASFKSGRWSVRTGYPELLSLALEVLAPEGLLWAAVNTEGLPREHLSRFVQRAFKDANREARVLATGGLPADYPTPAGKPQARYLKVFVLQAH